MTLGTFRRRVQMPFQDRPVHRASPLAAAAFVFAIAFCAPLGVAAAGELDAPRLLGASEKANHDLSQFPKWTEALQRYERERALEDAPCRGPCPLQRWKKFVSGLKGRSALQQLEAVNGYVNQTPYQADSVRFGAVDHWATPAEFIGRAGDCEDYAIAKYLSLRHLGWDDRNLRILVLNDEHRRELHAVLVAYHGGTAYILDNLAPAVLEHTAIRHYRPIFSINASAWFFHEGWSPNAPAAVVSSALRPATPGAETPAPFAPAVASPPGNAATPPPHEHGTLLSSAQPAPETAGVPPAQDRAR